MKRKHFIKRTALAVGGFTFYSSICANADILRLAGGKFLLANETRWRLHKDGRFDLMSPTLSLVGCLPSFDNQPLIIQGVKVTTNGNGGFISYQLPKGKLELTLSKDADSCFVRTKLIGMPNAPHTVYPIASGVVEGAEKFYTQPL